jgi:RNA polymerase sigma-70 factor (ECF subfamily)
MQTVPDWAGVVGKILDKDGSGMEDLYAAITGLAPGFLGWSESRQDDVHEVLVIVIEAIQRGELREPARLMGFVRTIVRRRAVAHIRGNIAERRRFGTGAEIAPSRDPSPEERFARRERLDSVLKRLRSRDREILLRFYIEEQLPDDICREMRLTRTQFRLYKSRALAQCFDPSPRRWNGTCSYSLRVPNSQTESIV